MKKNQTTVWSLEKWETSIQPNKTDTVIYYLFFIVAVGAPAISTYDKSYHYHRN
jgi:hypothetical protein